MSQGTPSHQHVQYSEVSNPIAWCGGGPCYDWAKTHQCTPDVVPSAFYDGIVASTTPLTTDWLGGLRCCIKDCRTPLGKNGRSGFKGRERGYIGHLVNDKPAHKNENPANHGIEKAWVGRSGGGRRNSVRNSAQPSLDEIAPRCKRVGGFWAKTLKTRLPGAKSDLKIAPIDAPRRAGSAGPIAVQCCPVFAPKRSFLCTAVAG